MAALTPDERWMLRVGGLTGIALGIGYLIIMGLYVPMGPPPPGAEARLGYIGAHTGAWWAILWLSVLTDLLFVPLFLALYLALKEVSRQLMLLAAICVALFVGLDLAITWTNYAALISLSGQYAVASQKSAAVIAATYPAAVLESNLLFVYNTLTLAVGILTTGWVMRVGAFGKAAAWLGLITGLLGIVSVFGPLLVSALSTAIILTSFLTTIWVMIVGYRLWGLAGPATR